LKPLSADSAAGTRQVRIKVEACGICHSDALVKEGYWPGIQYPRVPGMRLLAALTPSATTSSVESRPASGGGMAWRTLLYL